MTKSNRSYQPTLPERAFHGFYSLLLAIFTPLALLNLLIKSTYQDRDYKKRKLERFGFLPEIKNQGGILLHCVSVGEVVAASTIIKRIRKRYPDYPVTITTTTPTGSDRVKQIFGDSVSHCYLPYDLHLSMRALLRKVQPKMVLITEVELWPNLINACWRATIPVYIINARLTDRSARSYGKFRLLFYPMMQKITAICAQGERDFNNYKKLNLSKDKLFLTNNIKFDITLTDEDIEKAQEIQRQLNTQERRVLLGASTHEPEEDVLIESYKALKKDFPDLLLIITPRHPQRFGKVEKLVADQQLQMLKLSDDRPISATTDVVLIDKMGILKSVYSLATIAFVGGSIADKGGHNALEAALFAKPILMGEKTYNNPAICQTLIDAGALKITHDTEAIVQRARTWLTIPEEAKKAGDAGTTVLNQNAGAISKTLEIMGIDA